MSVVTFIDYTPTPRFDDKPWTDARIEGADLLAGPWTEVETIPLDPVDTNPERPITRSFTTELAGDELWFRIVFVDEDGDESATDPVPAVADPAFRPTLNDVGALLRARTKTTAAREGAYAQGEEIGTFNTDTRPSGTQVEALISQAVKAVAGRVGDVPVVHEGTAQHLAAVYAAMLVESSYFPEQIENGQSPYERFRDLWRDEIEQLTARMTGASGSRGLVVATLASPFGEDDTLDDLELPLD